MVLSAAMLELLSTYGEKDKKRWRYETRYIITIVRGCSGPDEDSSWGIHVTPRIEHDKNFPPVIIHIFRKGKNGWVRPLDNASE